MLNLLRGWNDFELIHLCIVAGANKKFRPLFSIPVGWLCCQKLRCDPSPGLARTLRPDWVGCSVRGYRRQMQCPAIKAHTRPSNENSIPNGQRGYAGHGTADIERLPYKRIAGDENS